MTQQDELLSWVLWQDEHIFLINKPAGVLCIQDGYDPLIPNIRQLYKELWEEVWIVHRLDRETSGILLLARNPTAHREINIQFERRKVQKEYHAILGHSPDWEYLLENRPLLVNADRQHRTMVNLYRGKPASTEFRLLVRAQEHALISAHPKSGYRHQIRAHLRANELTILNDHLYATKGNNSRLFVPDSITRLALHAYAITFIHPVTKQEMRFTAPYPPDFSQTLQKLNMTQV